MARRLFMGPVRPPLKTRGRCRPTPKARAGAAPARRQASSCTISPGAVKWPDEGEGPVAIGPNGVGLVLPVALAVAFAGVGAPVAAASCVLSEPQRGTVAQIIDGETLALTDGTIVRLIGAKAPSPPLGWRGDDPWPMVAEAKQALERLAAGAEIELRYGGRRVDRHGYALAQMFVAKGEARIWLQQELVAQGLARIYSFPDNRACIAELLESEAAARAARKGLWGVSACRIRDAGGDPEAIARLKHGTQISRSRSNARMPAPLWPPATRTRLPASRSGCGAGSSGGTAR